MSDETRPTPERDPEYEIALALRVVWFVDCERYDRTVCTGRRGDTAVPTNAEESSLMTANATAKMLEMHQRAKRLGVGERAMLRAADDRLFTMPERVVVAYYDWAIKKLAEAEARPR